MFTKFHFSELAVIQQRDFGRTGKRAGTAFNTVKGMKAAQLVEFVIVFDGGGYGKGTQPHRTNIDTFAAADTGRFSRFDGIAVIEQQYTRSQFGYRGVKVDGCGSHHSTAENNFADFRGIGTGTVNQIRRRGTNPNQIVCRFVGTFIAGNGYDTFKQWFVFHDCFINGIDSADVLDNAAEIQRQATRRHFSAGDGFNQLFLSALRIFAGADTNIDPNIAAGEV